MLKTLHGADLYPAEIPLVVKLPAIAADPPRPTPTIRKAPFRWRLKNTLRMAITGELVLPLWVAFLRLVSPRGVMFATAEVRGRVTHADGSVTDYGLLGRHLVVTAGKNYLASTMDNTAEPELLKFHGYGTGTTAAAAGDTALQTELTTQYAVDSTRPTGSQAHSGATYTTVATLSPDSGGTIAVTEWGLFTATSVGTLLDRQVFSAVNLVAGSDSLTTTYVLTFS